jgi:two-component system, cell cycle sensor histidine kinase and response regulator CckA
MSLKTLVVDDEDGLCEIITEVLKTLDIESKAALSGEEALDIAAQNDPFDLFIIDMNMPGMTGEETYNHLKEKYPDIPLVFMSGYDLSNELKAMNFSCPHTFLKKPFTITELAQTVSELLPKS